MQKALEAEFYADRRRGVNDAFVTEIPLLCSKVYSGAGPLITAARIRGHTADLAAGWDCTRRADRLTEHGLTVGNAGALERAAPRESARAAM